MHATHALPRSGHRSKRFKVQTCSNTNHLQGEVNEGSCCVLPLHIRRKHIKSQIARTPPVLLLHVGALKGPRRGSWSTLHRSAGHP